MIKPRSGNPLSGTPPQVLYVSRPDFGVEINVPQKCLCVTSMCWCVCVCNPVCAATAEGWRKAYLCVSLTARRLALLHLLHRADLRPGGCKPSVYPLLKKIHSVFVVTLTSQVWLLNEPPIPALTVCEQSDSYCCRFFFNVSVYIFVFSEEDQFPIGCIWSTGFNDSCMELWVNKRPVVISLYRTVTCMETRPAFHLYFKTNT